MKKIRIIFALAILFSLIGNISAQIKIAPKTKTLKKDVFDAAMSRMVRPNVMGYQYVLIKDGKFVTEGAGGKARTGSDGDLNMTTSTPINIGSLAKFLSGTARINLFEKPAPKTDSDYKKNGLQANLDRVIWAELPKVWLDQIPGPYVKGPQQRNITFRKLLQHRSGFDEDLKTTKKLTTFISALDEEFNPALFDKRKYTNMNFTLGGYLLPLIEYHNLNYDLDIETNGMSQTDADKLVRDKLGWRMDTLMRERIWSKMSPKFNITCDPTKDAKNTGAFGYINKDKKGGGVMNSMMETNGHCVGVGGYFTSARDLANYVAHFSQTDLIVTQAGRDAMYKEGMPEDDRVVWSVATVDNWIKTNFNMPYVLWSDGGSDGNRTVLVRLPNNYYLILFANSDDLKTPNLYNIGVAAFKEGMKHNF